MPSRRQFIRDCSLAAAAVLTPPVVLARGAGRREPASDSFARFTAQLNSQFDVAGEPGRVRLMLVEAAPLPPTAAGAWDARNERFSLLFRGPLREPLTQDTYVFEHPRLGRQPIFIVPVTGMPDTTAAYYAAIFNHPVTAADLNTQLALAPRPVPGD